MMIASRQSVFGLIEHDAASAIETMPSLKEFLFGTQAPEDERSDEEDDFRHAGTTGKGQDVFEYAIDAAGRAHIVHCGSHPKHVRIPESIDGCPVAVIGPHAFSTCYELERLELPDSLEEIRKHAFMNTALREFRAPERLSSIGAKAFYHCRRLENVVLDDRLATIGESAFCESAVARLDVPPSVTRIGHDAFRETRLVFSGEEPTLRIAAENRRYGLYGGSIYEATPAGLSLFQALDEDMRDFAGDIPFWHVANRAFSFKPKLRHVRLPEGVVSVGDAAFKGCRSLQDIELPDSLRAIGKRAFWGTALTSVRIPAQLESAGTAAFFTGDTTTRHYEPSIVDVEVSPENRWFYLENDALCQRLPDGGAAAVLYFGTGGVVEVPRSVTQVGPYAYLSNMPAKQIVLHDGIESVDVGGIDFRKSNPLLVYEMAGDPPRRYVVKYPPGEAGRQTMRMTFGLGVFDIGTAFADSDRATVGVRDLYTRSRLMVERLMKPDFLSDQMEMWFRNRLKPAVPKVALEFGRNGYLQGVDALLELGLLDEGNIEAALDAAMEANEVAVTSRLMEIRRIHFDLPMFDFDL